MDFELQSQRRQLALAWWRKLTREEQEKIAAKYCPDWSFIMVTRSTPKIVSIWGLIHP